MECPDSALQGHAKRKSTKDSPDEDKSNVKSEPDGGDTLEPTPMEPEGDEN